MLTKKTVNISLGKCLIYSVLIIVSLFCFIPLVAVISISISDEKLIREFGYRLIPMKVNMAAYVHLLKNPEQILNAYKITGIVTVIGTAFALLVNSMIAYALSRRDFIMRNFLSFFVFVPMIFSGGMVSSYILITKYLGLKDTMLVLILPLMVNAWNIIILRTYFSSIPSALIESAKIDGAKEFTIFFKILVPLSTSSLATIGFFIMLVYWNDWFMSMLYITKAKYYSLQFLLVQIMNKINELKLGGGMDMSGEMQDIPSEGIRMAMCLVVAGPALLVFPFLQKYFVKGIMVGSVKG